MTLQKVPAELGGVPTPTPGDEDKALIADGSGGYYWGNPAATVPTQNAVDVLFDNTEVKIPNDPTELQAALEEAYKRIPATKIVKMPEPCGGDGSGTNMAFIREDGVAILFGESYNSWKGVMLQGTFNSSTWGFGAATEIRIPEYGRKVFSVAPVGGFGMMLVVSTDGNPRSELWVSGGVVGQGSVANSSSLTKIYSANAPGERIKKVYGAEFYSNLHTGWYLRDDGKLYGTGSQTHGQLGNGVTSNNIEYSFVQSQSGALTYIGGQRVTNVFSTGFHSFAEVTTDDTTYKLIAVGRNSHGQIGTDVILDPTPIWTQCKRAQPSIGDMESVGGPFRKILSMEDDPYYNASTFVLTHDKNLYHTGWALGGGNNRKVFTLVDSSVEDVAITGGSDGSFIYCKTDGTVKGAGYNFNFCLGNGTTTYVPIASPILLGPFGSSNKAVEVFGAFGSPYHTFFVRTETGDVYAAGMNLDGLTGVCTPSADNEGNGDVTTWSRVSLPEPVVPGGVATLSSPNNGGAAGGTSYFLGVSGTLWGSGSNRRSALGYPQELVSVKAPLNLRIPNGQWISGRWDFLNT